MENKKTDMPLLSHLRELRTRLFRSLIILTILAFVAFGYTPEILNLFQALFSDAFTTGTIIGTKPAEAFTLRIKLAVIAAILFGSPYYFGELWFFLSPGLTEKERKLMLPFVISATGLFVGGAFFCYTAVLPIVYKFFADQFLLLSLEPNIQISEHLAMSIKLVLCFALMFELPVISWLLARVGLLTYQFMKDTFRYTVVLIFIVAAVLTPPDVVSQLLMAAPLLVLYLISMLIVKYSEDSALADQKT